MSDSISWGHIEAANSLLGIAPPPPVRPRRGTPRPTTRELWADEVGKLLQSLVPQGGWYGDWCPTLGLDDFCVRLARDVQCVAEGGNPVLQHVALNNAVGRDGRTFVHGSPHWISVVYSVQRA